MTRTTSPRRTILGSGASLLLLSAATAGQAKADELDGDLLRACASYLDLNEKIDAIDARVLAVPMDETPEMAAVLRALDKELTALVEAEDPLLRIICETPACTPEGIRAKAAVVEAAINIAGREDDDSYVSPYHVPIWSLVRDILGAPA